MWSRLPEGGGPLCSLRGGRWRGADPTDEGLTGLGDRVEHEAQRLVPGPELLALSLLLPELRAGRNLFVV